MNHRPAGRHEYLIIGAGPAGLQLGYYLQRAGRDYLILEAGQAPGGFFRRFPRHRRLISINKVHTGYDDPEVNLRWDWNSLLDDGGEMRFPSYSRRYFPSADDLVRYLEDFARHFQINVQYGTAVSRISRSGEGFDVADAQGGLHRCDRLIVAAGVTRPVVPSIPGIELAEQYTEVSVDPEDFVDQSVLIIGKGNSAFETADNLIEAAARIHVVSPRPLTFAWKSHFVGHVRAINAGLIDTYQLKLQNAVLDATLDRLERTGDGRIAAHVSYRHAGGEREMLCYDRVICCAGFRFDGSLFDQSCRPEMAIDGRFPSQTSGWESTNVPDLYFAGTLMQMRDYRRSNSGFIHGFRYNLRALARMLAARYHGQAWPHRPVEAGAEAMAAALLERINRSSALWQQPGFLCDLLIVGDGGARYYEELPVDYVRDGDLGRANHYYTATLEFGPEHASRDPLVDERVPRHDTARAADSRFLHPVVRRYRAGELVEEHHVIEDLAAEWREPEHTQPLLQFFARQRSAV